MVALQNRPSCLFHKKKTKKNLNYRQRPNFRGPGGGAGTRADSRVEYLFCLSFSLSSCATRKHGRHLPELSLAAMSRKANESAWNMKGMSTYKTTKKKLLSFPREIKAKPALHFFQIGHALNV